MSMEQTVNIMLGTFSGRYTGNITGAALEKTINEYKLRITTIVKLA